MHAGDQDPEWPEFVFVTAAHGTGWVPARYLSQPFGPAVVQTRYDTTELPTQVSEVLEVVAEDVTSGWLWCRSSTGRQGWVPIRTRRGRQLTVATRSRRAILRRAAIPSRSSVVTAQRSFCGSPAKRPHLPNGRSPWRRRSSLRDRSPPADHKGALHVLRIVAGHPCCRLPDITAVGVPQTQGDGAVVSTMLLTSDARSERVCLIGVGTVPS